MVCLDFLSLDRTLCSPFLRGARDFVAARVPAETEQGGPRPVAGPGSTPSLQGLGCTSLWLWSEWAWATPHLSCINDQACCRICHTRKSTSALPAPPRAGWSEDPLSDATRLPSCQVWGHPLPPVSLLSIGKWFHHRELSFYQQLRVYVGGKNEKNFLRTSSSFLQIYPRLKSGLCVTETCWMNRKERITKPLSQFLNYLLRET